MAAFFKFFWFRRRTPVRSQSRQATWFRPRLEALEGRLAPATFTVTSTTDPATITSGTLRWAIQQVNNSSDPSDTIVIQNTGTYTLNSTLGALIINPTVNLAKTVTIKGADPSNPGGTLIQGNGDRVFEIDGNNLGVHVLFQDLAITGGNPAAGKNGGGIYLKDPSQLPNVDSVALSNVILKGNAVSASAGSGGLGGGLYADRGSISVLGSIIGAAGAPNSAVQGGGIYSGGGTIFISNSIVTNNTATGSGGTGGGGIYQAGNGAVTISGSILSNNQATSSNGGALYDAATLAPLTLVGSAVKNNSATGGGSGGGIYYTGSNLTISNSHVDNNSAPQGSGGGIVNAGSNSTLTISGSILNGNTAGAKGGALFNSGAAIVSISGSNFTNGLAALGGVLEDDAASKFTAQNSLFNGNAASTGGALYLNKSIGDYLFVNVVLNNNTASGNGGAVYVANAHSVTFNTVSIQNNTAGSSGGGIANTAGGVNLGIYNSIVTNNQAQNSNGGGISDTGSFQLIISGSIVSGNIAKNAGGSVASNSVNATIIGSNFNNSTVQGNGGPGGGGFFFSGYGTLTMNNSQMINDSAPLSDGGAFLILNTGTGTNVNLSGVVIQNNAAGKNGGAIAFGGGNNGMLVIDHSNVSGNVALAGSGGAVHAMGNTVIVRYSELDNNAAQVNGGAINLINSGAPNWVLAYSTLAFNQAGGDGGALAATSSPIGGTFNVINSTIVNNQAVSNGGGIAIEGNNNKLVTSLLFVTIDKNKVQLGEGGGVFNDEGIATALGNTVIAMNNAPSGPDLFGRFADLVLGATTVGHNWIGADPTTGYGGLTNGVNGDRLGMGNPLLNSLGNNGGATLTQSLQAGSPLLNTALITADVQAVTTTDQRGISRPQPAGTHGDIGAFESGLG